MRVITGLAFILMALGEAAAAQTQTAAPPERLRVSVNAGTAPSSNTFAGSTTLPVNLETETINTTYAIRRGQLFDGGIVLRLAGPIGVGIAVSLRRDHHDADVTAAVPHLFSYNAFRSVEGTAALDRREVVTHLQAVYIIRPARGLDVVLSIGPSFFHVEQQLVSDVTYVETYPFDIAAFSGVSTTAVSARTTGFNAGADVAVRLSDRIGIGGLARFTRGSIEFAQPNATTSVTSDAGGLQLAGGLRLFF